MDEIQCLQQQIMELSQTPGVYWLPSDANKWVTPDLFTWLLQHTNFAVLTKIHATRIQKPLIFVDLSNLNTTVDTYLLGESLERAKEGAVVILYGPRRFEPACIQHTDPYGPMLMWMKGLVDRALRGRTSDGDVCWIPSDALPDGLLDYIDSKVNRIRNLYQLTHEILAHNGDDVIFIDISDSKYTDPKYVLRIVRLLNEQGAVLYDGNLTTMNPKPSVVCLAPHNWPYQVFDL